MSTKDEYNKLYSKKRFYWGIKPHKLTIELQKILQPSSKVLDLGCGEGKDAMYLAQKGYNVTATDISEEGIKKLQNLAKEKEISIKTTTASAEKILGKKESYDAIVCLNVLQFIEQNKIKETIKNIQKKTKKNGFNVIATFIAENETQKKNVTSKGRYLFNEGELKRFYKDWKIISYSEELGEWETHGLPKHRHFKALLIAQKEPTETDIEDTGISENGLM